MTVYADILFVLNLAVNFYLLLFAARLAKESARFLRLLGASAFGAAAAFGLFLPDFGFLFSLIYRLVVSAVCVWIAFGARTRKRFLRLFAAFFASTFLFAGLMLALWQLFKIENMVIRNGAVYYDLSPLLLIGTTSAAYLLLSLFRKFAAKRAAAPDKTYEIAVELNGTEARFPALYDTGNQLTDPVSEAPVIVAEYALVEQLLPEQAREVYRQGLCDRVPAGMERRHRVIPYRSVGGGGLLPGFVPDAAAVRAQGFGKIRRAVVAVSPRPLGGEHRAVVGAALLERCRDETDSDSDTPAPKPKPREPAVH